MPENPNRTCLVCNKRKHPGDRRDFCHRGEYLSTHLADGVDYKFNICDDCVLAWHISGLLHTNDESTCSRCHCSVSAGHHTMLGVVFTAFLPEGAEDVRLCEGCLVGLFDAAEPEAKPGMYCTIDSQEMPSSKYNWDGSEKSMDAVVGAPEMKIEPVAFKIVIKPADAGVKEKTMDTSEEIVVGKINQLKTEGSRVAILLDSGRWLWVTREGWSVLFKECGDLGYGFDEEVVFHVARSSEVVAWHPKDSMRGLVYDKHYSGYDSHGVFEKVVLDNGEMAEIRFRLDSGPGDLFWIENFEQAERRFGKLVPGTRYEWLVADQGDASIVGWREAPLTKTEADTVSKPEEQEPVGVPKEGADQVGVFLRWESDKFVFERDNGRQDFWVSEGKARDAAIARCGDMVPGKRYRWLWGGPRGYDIMGWREEPLPKSEADTVSKAKDPMEGVDYIREGGAAERFGIVHSLLEGEILLSANTFTSKRWTCYHYAEVAKRCGELVPGKSYQFFFATKDWDLVGWKEADIPDGMQVFSYDNDVSEEEPEPKSAEPVIVTEEGEDQAGVFLRWEGDRFVFERDDGFQDSWFSSGKSRDAAIARCGDMVPGKRYRWLWNEDCGGVIMGWREEPLSEAAPEPKATESFGVPEYGFNSVGVFLHWEKYSFVFQNEHGVEGHWFVSGPRRDEAIARCGDMVHGKRYRWLWNKVGGGEIAGWREEPKPALPAPAAPPADPPMSAMRFMAKRLGVRLPDDVAGVGHATNVIEDALGAKMQQAMADTGFGVIHDILRDLGIDLEDNKGEPLGSYRHRVQAAIRGRIALAEMEGHDAGVNEVLKSLEDQIEDGERQRKMLVEQLERVIAHRVTLQQVHADARKMRRGGAS